ncbi:MAG: alginate lyase family protein [Paenibacillus dendritiformis]|uniref:alginate lyase family protein n=1 Tax=uncultured Paenibacillus sp. TaxID=227322 RepID=UPI0025E9BE8C|nr:alginate lyase family protein [uncultured Paenibacillus sp.]MDU5141607.1 alginate lyase family protein [Paenibacillus dendritiformis]
MRFSHRSCDFGFTINEFNLGKEYLLAVKPEVYIEYAEKIMDGQLIVFTISKRFVDGFLKYDINEFDWGVQTTQSPNSFQMNLQGLSMLVPLCAAYLLKVNESGETASKYLYRAIKIFYSWLDYSNNVFSVDNPYLWNDHAVALRTENIIFFALSVIRECYSNKQLINDIKVTLVKQGLFLYDDQNYFKRNNHGIFQDRALIYCACFINDRDNSKAWVEKAKIRLKDQKDFAFNNENVHVENSPGYHVIVMQLFKQIAEFLVQFDDEFGMNLYEDVVKAAEFMVYMLKPNGRMAEVGDTDGSLSAYLQLAQDKDLFHNPRLTYAATRGIRGESPTSNVGIFKRSGYYIYREHWCNERMEESTWLLFKSGYSSRSHKHSDDLSFMLYTKGYDVFIDPGWFNYMWGNKYREYLTSSRAHNTIVVDGQSYSTTDENNYKTGILIFKKGTIYDYILGFNDAYQGVKIDRHFYRIGSNAILLFDNIKSSENHTYSQMFHLLPSTKIITNNENEILLKVSNNCFVRIKQLIGKPKLFTYTGDFQNSDYGYISRGFNHIDSTNCLKFDFHGRNCDLITLITIENEKGNTSDYKDFNFDPVSKLFSFKQGNNLWQFELKDRTRFDISKILITELKNNSFHIVNQSEAPEGTQYAWYLIEQSTKETVFKTVYMNENSIILDIPNTNSEKVYLLKAYMRSSLYQRKQEIVGKFQMNSVSMKYEFITPKRYGLRINSKRIEQTGERTYRFIVDYDYSFNIRIQWLIYKNGGAKESIFIDNSGLFEYSFPEKGVYAVMFYFRTSGGDNEFYCFPEIEI